MTTEQDLKCPSCNCQIETAYCGSCKETIFIKPTKTIVVNIKNSEYDIFIGRENKKFHYGNPFTHLNYPTRAKIKMNTVEESVQAFEEWLMGNEKYKYIEPERRKWILENIKQLKGKRLGCFCRPKNGFKGKKICHGQIIASLVDNIPPESID